MSVTGNSGSGNAPIGGDGEDEAKARALEGAKSLSGRLQGAKSEQLREVVTGTHSLYQCLKKDVDTQVAVVSTQYSTSLAQLGAVIKSLSDRGIDPSDIKNADGTSSNLIERRAQLESARDQALASLLKAKDSMDASERDLVSKLM